MNDKKISEVTNERLELLKNSGQGFVHKDNKVFARTMSTPIEDQKPISFLKKQLKKPSQLTEFVPGANNNLAADFLGVGATTNPETTTAPTQTFTNTTAKPLTSNGTATEFVPSQTTNKVAPSSQTSVGSTDTTKSTQSTAPVQPEKKTVETDAAKPKKTLKLSSTSFNVGSGAINNAGASNTTTKTGSPSKDKQAKINLASANIKPLETIPENKTEDKVEQKIENKPSTIESTQEKKVPLKQREEGKKIEEFRPQGKTADQAQAKEQKKAEDLRKEAAEKAEKERQRKAEEEAAAKAREAEFEKQKEKEREEERRRKEEEERENERRRKEQEQREAERKAAEEEERKKREEKAKREVKVEILVMGRLDLEAKIRQLAEAMSEIAIPEHILKIKNRDIIIETTRGGGGGGNKTYNKQPSLQQPKPMERNTSQVSASTEDSITRNPNKKESVVEPPKTSLVRMTLTEEERRKKDELCKNVGVWIQSKKGEIDPEEAIKKEIKFNLNIITLDNFDVIREKIHEIASAKQDNCKRVAEFIIENAWTQKQYVNTYAKLCDYLGRSEKLMFEDGKTDAKKKKNLFKLHIMKQIQTVFEDETNANLGFKKTVEEMDAEEKGRYFAKKKQRILGNVSFIGELFLEKFLVVGIVRIITNSLLQRLLDEYDAYQKAVEKPTIKFYEDTLEGLLKFYEIIGKAVEEKEQAKAVDKAKSNAVLANFQKLLNQSNSATPTSEAPTKLGQEELSLDALFKIFEILLNQGSLSTRLDSLVKNLIHRKENKWQAPLSKNQGPKTLKEIHEEFEREQLEIERSGDQYREELMYTTTYQPRDQGRQQRVGGKEVIFQVSQEPKNKAQEEAKLDVKVDIDSNISFRPQRGKGNEKTDPKASVKKTRSNNEEIEKELKEIYKLINGEPMEDRETPEEELKKLASKNSGRDILHIFYRSFYDGRLDTVKKRLFIPNYLYDEKIITAEDFMDKFKEAMLRMFEVACDYPESDNNFAIIFLEYCKRVGDLSPLNQITFTPEFYANTDDCMIVLEFYWDFFRAVLGNLDGDYSDLQDKVKEDEMKEFSKRIKIENYEEFKKGL